MGCPMRPITCVCLFVQQKSKNANHSPLRIDGCMLFVWLGGSHSSHTAGITTTTTTTSTTTTTQLQLLLLLLLLNCYCYSYCYYYCHCYCYCYYCYCYCYCYCYYYHYYSTCVSAHRWVLPCAKTYTSIHAVFIHTHMHAHSEASLLYFRSGRGGRGYTQLF